MDISNFTKVLDEPYGGWNGSKGVYGRITLYNGCEMETFNHAFPFGRSQGDNGGPWRMVKTTTIPSAFHYNGRTGGGGQSYEGPVLPGTNTGVFTPPASYVAKTDSELTSLGSSLLSQALPTNPSFSLATLIGETVERVPSIIGSTILRDRTKLLKNSGSEYLNLEFGWKPLMSDLRSFSYAVKHSNKVLNSYIRNSDKKIRRRRVGTNVSNSSEYKGTLLPYVSLINEFGTGTITYTLSEKTWFSGAFRYHIPVSDTVAGKMARFESLANHLLGVRLTPAVVWELAPWSWAVDWFTNTGDIINNISSLGQDGLAMEYGYVMHSSSRMESRRATYFGRSCGLDIHTEIKQRLPASPFGFGLTYDSLSEKQIAVLAALGLSRGGR